MYSVQTTFGFEAAHRLYDVNTYSEECRNNLHGHSYQVTVVVGRSELNDAGMVIDFKLLKHFLKEQIEDRYDHSCILKSTDPLCQPIVENCDKVIITDDNPTAEWMSEIYYKLIDEMLEDIDDQLILLSVKVQETAKNIAIRESEL